MQTVVAVDAGGTKLTAALIDEAGRIAHRLKWPVENATAAATAEQIAHAIHEVSRAAEAPPVAAGLIIPGIYYAQSGMAWAPNLWGHQDVPLAAELAARTALPVVIDDDRAGCVLGERWLGAAKGVGDAVFCAFGTGIGAGIVSGGRLIRGAHGIAGAVGWMTLDPHHNQHYARTGCFEAEAAGPALARRMNMARAEDVIAAARAGNEAALAAIAETARYIGMGVANVVSLLNPEVVVLGGGLMQAGPLFLPRVREVVAERAQPVAARRVRIELSQLGEDAGLFGAAWLALDHRQPGPH